MNNVKIVLFSLVVIVIGAGGFFMSSSGLKSDPNIGLSPDTHRFSNVDIRKFTQAPLGAEVKVYLPIPPRKALAIAYEFDNYPQWVSPPPENVTVDNSYSQTGEFGVGSKVSYKEGETDVIEFLDRDVAMVAKPLWAVEDFSGHRGAVIVQPYRDGSLMHMRRYFEVTSFKGWMMSKVMPMFMKSSAENLVEQYGGEVL